MKTITKTLAVAVLGLGSVGVAEAQTGYDTFCGPSGYHTTPTYSTTYGYTTPSYSTTYGYATPLCTTPAYCPTVSGPAYRDNRFDDRRDRWDDRFDDRRNDRFDNRFDDWNRPSDHRYRHDSVRHDRYDVPKLGSAWPGPSRW